MGKVDTTGIEELFIETPVRKRRQEAQIKAILREPKTREPRALKPLKQPQNGLQGISSLRLVRELIVRHYKFVLSTLFWIGVGVIVGTR